ncbi:MAG TPA: ATP-binding protein [Terriglobia bacterium]|nr:ATP-binding protein [Terriglobia bacterium]
MWIPTPESRNHFGSIYDSFDERVILLSGFLKDGFERNERCVCMVSDSDSALLTSSLDKLGIRVDMISQTGFGPDQLLKRVQSELQSSITAHFTGMRWAADMGWILQLEAPEQSLLECEALVDGLAHSQPVTYLCMFSREKFRDHIVQGILRTHSALIAGNKTYEVNPFYEPGDLVQTCDVDKRIEWALNQLAYLQHLKDEAEHPHELFLHRLSHELKTPMTTIIGWCNLIDARKVSPAHLAQAVDAIKRNADLQNRLIEELMDACRLASGKLTLSRRPVRLARLLLDSIESFAPIFRAKGVDLTCRFDVSTATVCVDPIRLQQIVGNLLTNSLKFTPAEGRVSVDLVLEESAAVITVRDTGEGISSELLPHLFERFAQGESAKSMGGLGLGLSIVHDLVKLHGGTVNMESPGEGGGTAVSIRLPLDSNPELDIATKNAKVAA